MMMKSNFNFSFNFDRNIIQRYPLEISGSADVYYKYDFAKKENIGLVLQLIKIVSLGMLDFEKQLVKPLCRGFLWSKGNFSLYLMAMEYLNSSTFKTYMQLMPQLIN
jgi:hypothetical protein